MHRYDESQRLYQEARQVLAGGVSSNFRYGTDPVPLFYSRGQGAHLIDVDGNDYIDYALGNGPVILGHAPPRVIEAVAATLGQGQLYAAQHEAEVTFARTLQRLIPCAELIRFSSSGSEAVHAAVRLARAATGRAKVIKFEGHYHGWLDNIIASVRPALNAAGPREEPRALPESPGQTEGSLADVVALPWNDLEVLERALARHKGTVAGIIMEPIMANTCVVPPRPGYLEGARRLCDREGVVLIFDEVITGFRVGLSSAQGLLGVTPDLAVFAKALAAGFPLSALVGRRHVMELLETKGVMHGGTYNSNVVCISAGIATIDQLSENGGVAYARMEARGRRIIDGLTSLARRHGHAIRIQGYGTVFHPAFTDMDEITDYRSFTKVDALKQRAFVTRLQHAGVRLTTRGTWFLSTAHGEDDVERSLEAADRILAELK
ncbi:MAG: aspartate aminotransferase family protein [Alphaproteobacteria bacterium]